MLRILLCDRNHIIDWHTESCPSNSPRRAAAAAAAASEENKGRFFFEADGVHGQKTLLPRCLGAGVLFVSRAPLGAFAAPMRNNGDGDRGAEFQVGGLFPVSKYSRCHLCSFELLHPARL